MAGRAHLRGDGRCDGPGRARDRCLLLPFKVENQLRSHDAAPAPNHVDRSADTSFAELKLELREVGTQLRRMQMGVVGKAIDLVTSMFTPYLQVAKKCAVGPSQVVVLA